MDLETSYTAAEIDAILGAQPTPTRTPIPVDMSSAELDALLGGGSQGSGSMLANALAGLQNYGGQAVGGAIEGIAGLGGTALDAAELVMPNSPTTYSMDKIQQAGQYAKSINDYLGIERPEGTYERAARNVGTFVPDAFLPMGGSFPRRVVSSLAGALGLTGAEEVAPENPYVQMAGAVLGSSAPDAIEGTAKAGLSVMRGGMPNTQQIERSVGGMINETGLTEAELAQAVQSKLNPANEFTQFQTTAELTSNPRMAALEDTAKTLNAPEAAIRQVARDDLRTRQLESIIPGAAPGPEQFGEGLRAITDKAHKKSKRVVDRLYRTIDPENITEIDTADLRATVRKDIKNLASIEKFNPRLKGTAADIVTELMRKDIDKEAVTEIVKAMADGTLDANTLDTLGGFLAKAEEAKAPKRSVQDLVNLRSTSWQLADQLEAAGDMKQAAVMKGLAANVNKRLDKAIKTKEISPEMIDQLRLADRLYGKDKELFDTGIIKSRVRAENVDPISLARQSPDFSPQTVRKLKTIIKRGAENSEEAKFALNDYRRTVLAELSERATTTTGEITPGAMRKALRMRSRMPMLKELFDPPHIRRLDNIYDDLLSQEKVQRVGRAASRGQSVTAQRTLQAGAIMDQAMLGVFDRVPGIGPAIRALRTSGSEEAARKILAQKLFDAAMEPQIARQLAMSASKPLPPNSLEMLLAQAFGAMGSTSVAVQQ